MSKNGSYTKRSDIVTFETNDFDKFHKADYNRNLNNGLVKKLEKSMKEYGYIGAPIIVDEYYAVVDGQHRLQACKNTDTPVLYSRIPGLTQKHFIALNIAQKDMRIDDFIVSNAGQGNENYVRLYNLMRKYPKFSTEMFIHACHSSRNVVKGGNLKLSENDCIFINKHMEKMERFLEFKKEVFVNREKDMKVIYRLFEAGLADSERMYEKLNKYRKYYVVKNTDYDIVAALQDIYNRNARNNIVYFTDKYKEAYPSK